MTQSFFQYISEDSSDVSGFQIQLWKNHNWKTDDIITLEMHFQVKIIRLQAKGK